LKFSLIYEAQTVDASRQGDRNVFDDMVEQCLLAEEVGFDVRPSLPSSRERPSGFTSGTVSCVCRPP